MTLKFWKKRILFSYAFCIIFFSSYAENGYENIWKEYSKKDQIAYSEFSKRVGNHLNLGEKNSFEFLTTQEDNLGYSHHRYQQYYDGIPVESGIIIIHEYEGRVYLINGIIGKNFSYGGFDHLKSSDVIELASNYIPCQEYVHENRDYIERGKELGKDINPIPKKVFYLMENNSENLTEYQLAYKITLECSDASVGKTLFFDIHNGKILGELSTIQSWTTGIGIPHYNNYTSHNIEATKLSSNLFYLVDFTRGAPINTEYYGITFSNTNNIWTNGSERLGAQAHWGVGHFYDLIKNEFGRDGYDDQNSMMRTNLGNHPDWAYYSNTFEYVSLGPGGILCSDWLISLDVVGHEWAHGIVQHTAGLGATTESSALNESFGDIFGTMNEFYVETNIDPDPNMIGDWLLGEEFWIEDGFLRNMQEPHSKDNPDTYLGDFWNGANNHEKGLVPSHGFYLLSEGGQGINNHPTNPYSYSLIGISKDDAFQVAYRSLSYLTPSSSFYDARVASIQSGIDLFGRCSWKVQEIVEAWNAVGVYDNGEENWKFWICGEERIGNFENSATTTSAKVYPNPVSETLSVRINGKKENFRLSVFNNSGEEINVQTRFVKGVFELDFDGLPTGIYFVKVVSKHKSENFKVIVN